MIGLTHFVKSHLLPACHPVPAILLCHTSPTSYFQYFHYSALPVCVCVCPGQGGCVPGQPSCIATSCQPMCAGGNAVCDPQSNSSCSESSTNCPHKDKSDNEKLVTFNPLSPKYHTWIYFLILAVKLQKTHLSVSS